MMNRLNTFLMMTGLVLICGCASHGRNILLHYEDETIADEILKSKMEWLEPVVAEGKTHEQFRIVRALRYAAKYQADPARRQLAVRGLLFITVFADDSDVRASAQSRLTTILNDADEDIRTKTEIITGKQQIVTGHLFYRKAHTSLFSNLIEYEPWYPDSDDREAALIYLMDHFEELPEELKPTLIDAFRKILNNAPVCLEKTAETCTEDDAEEQESWKKNLGTRISQWLYQSCPWQTDERLSPTVRNSLTELAGAFPEYVLQEDGTSCPPFNPVSEDTVVLEQRSLAIPGRHLQIGLTLLDPAAEGVHLNHLELGWGNRGQIGLLIGLNIDDRWMEPLREKYVNLQYRLKNTRTAMGITRTLRLTDVTLASEQSDQVEGAVDDQSLYVNTRDENELYLTSVFDVPALSTHLHLFLGSITQSLAAQYFVLDPDLSIVIEGYIRQEPEVDDRLTDTEANQDKAERREQAQRLRWDLMIGVKWNNLDLLKKLFVGETRREARKGMVNARIYYALERQQLFMGLMHPF